MDPAVVIAWALGIILVLGGYLIATGSAGFGIALMLMVFAVVAFVMSARI
jgi:hypothetical protein